MNGHSISISVNNRVLTVPEGANLLDTLQAQDFRIPALCFHPPLKHPIGACRLCTVRDDENVRTISIRDEVIGRHPLVVCEGCGKRFATQKFLEATHRRTHDHPDVKEHHSYCPVCAKRLSMRVLRTPLK